MTNPLILLFTFFIIAVVNRANANHCEGDYTKDVQEVLRGIDQDRSVHEGRVANNLSLHRVPFKDICNSFDKNKKLSICMKVLQQRWREREPLAFTVDPTESDCECQPVKFSGRNNATLYQRMYLCPSTTVRAARAEYLEQPFLIGQGLHNTQYRVRVFERSPTGGAVKILGQLTGFRLSELSFHTTPNGHIEYWPHYDEIGPARDVVNFRESGKMEDYLVQWELVPES